MSLFFAFLLFPILKCVTCGKILVVPAHIGPSHAFPLFELADALAARSHDVLVWYPTGIPPERVSRHPKLANMEAFFVPIDDQSVMDFFVYENASSGPMDDIWNAKTDFDNFMSLGPIYDFIGLVNQEYQKAILRDHRDKLDKIIQQQDWDLVIVDDMFCPIGHLISELTKTPLVIYSTTMLQEGLAFNYDLPINPSYLPSMSSASPSDEMSFWQRFNNLFFVGYDVLLTYQYHQKMTKTLEYYLAGQNGLKSYWEIRQSADFIFIIFPAKLEYPRPWLSNVINMGNPACKKVDQKLPKALETRVNAAKGLMIFAFGHHVTWKQAPPVVIENFADAFANFPDYLVVWKLDADKPRNLPENVIIMDFLPQPALLNHPKASAFLTHGGLGSVMETICAGVPIIGIPFGGDQMANLARLLRHEVGVLLQSSDFYSSEKIAETLGNVLGSKMYKKNMMGLKASFGDDLMTNLERAVFWSEFAVRHKGAGPLRATGLDGVSLIAFYHLDFCAVAILSFCLMAHLAKIFIRKFVGFVGESLSDRNV